MVEEVKRVLFISSNSSLYGAERSLCKTISVLKKSKEFVPVVVVAQRGELSAWLIENNIDVYCVPFKGIVNHNMKFQLRRGTLKLIYNSLCALFFAAYTLRMGQKFNLVHTNTITTDFGWLLSKILKLKHVFHIREVLKAFDFDVELGDKYLKKLLESSSQCICISKYTLDIYKSKYKNINATLLYNCVESNQEESENRPSKAGSKIALVGRLDKDKDWETALEAAKILSGDVGNFTMHFFGTGHVEKHLKKLTENYSLQRIVKFHGYVEQIDLSVFDIGVICSEYEAFGRVTVEYALNQMVIVGAYSGGSKELIDLMGGIGFIPGDANDLAKVLKQILTGKETQLINLQKSRLIALKLFNSSTHLKDLRKIYQELLV